MKALLFIPFSPVTSQKPPKSTTGLQLEHNPHSPLLIIRSAESAKHPLPFIQISSLCFEARPISPSVLSGLLSVLSYHSRDIASSPCKGFSRPPGTRPPVHIHSFAFLMFLFSLVCPIPRSGYSLLQHCFATLLARLSF